MWVSFNVGSPVVFPELGGVVVVLSVGWDNFVTKSSWLIWNSWDHNVLEVMWVVVVSGNNSGDEGDDGVFHFFLLKI